MQSGAIWCHSTASASLWASNTGGNAVLCDCPLGRNVSWNRPRVSRLGAPSILVRAVLKSGQSISDRLSVPPHDAVDATLLPTTARTRRRGRQHERQRRRHSRHARDETLVYSAANAPLWRPTRAATSALTLGRELGQCRSPVCQRSTLWRYQGSYFRIYPRQRQSLRDRAPVPPDDAARRHWSNTAPLTSTLGLNTSGNPEPRPSCKVTATSLSTARRTRRCGVETSGNAGAAVRSARTATSWWTLHRERLSGHAVILVQGSELTSVNPLGPDEPYRLTMQGDGNLVEYSATNQCCGPRTRAERGAVAIMQTMATSSSTAQRTRRCGRATPRDPRRFMWWPPTAV